MSGKAEKQNVNAANQQRADASEMTPERREFLLSQTQLGQSVIKARRDVLEAKNRQADGSNSARRKGKTSGRDSGKAPKVLGEGKDEKCSKDGETTRNLVS